MSVRFAVEVECHHRENDESTYRRNDRDEHTK